MIFPLPLILNVPLHPFHILLIAMEAAIRRMLASRIRPTNHGICPYIIHRLLRFHHQLKLGEEFMPPPTAPHWSAHGPLIPTEPVHQGAVVGACSDSQPRLVPARKLVERSHKGIRLFFPQ